MREGVLPKSRERHISGRYEVLNNAHQSVDARARAYATPIILTGASLDPILKRANFRPSRMAAWLGNIEKSSQRAAAAQNIPAPEPKPAPGGKGGKGVKGGGGSSSPQKYYEYYFSGPSHPGQSRKKKEFDFIDYD
ncbi:MAG: hypothetical protein P4M15_07955 [Alphaproteobacteria bacterium]|nr:hypothetical protein [Alphaproteobacteria bacterium]